MRFILTIVIWLVIVGGLWSYSRQRQIAENEIVRQAPTIAQVEDLYSLNFTPTFSVEPDPFALQVEDVADAAIALRLNGIAIPIDVESVRRGVPFKLEEVEGLVVGNNEIYVQASPPITESDIMHGVRIQLEKAGKTTVDRTIWGKQGSLVSGTIHFKLEAPHEQHDH